MYTSTAATNNNERIFVQTFALIFLHYRNEKLLLFPTAFVTTLLSAFFSDKALFRDREEEGNKAEISSQSGNESRTTGEL